MFAASSAYGLTMTLPIDCNMKTDCSIRNYVDHKPEAGHTDFTCGALSKNGSRGTDFAVNSRAAYEKGVNVLAAADGTVEATRDLMIDAHAKTVSKKLIKRGICGNSVVLSHAGGWKTQYCHLKKDSVAVQVGDKVKAGDVLAQVGLSGNTEYPHLHFKVKQNSTYYDPFTAGDANAPCSVSPQRKTLWQSDVARALPYQPTGFVGAGFNDVEPDANNSVTRMNAKTELSHGADGIYFWSSVYGVKAGDTLQLKLVSPSGLTIAQDELFIQQDASRVFHSVGHDNQGLLSHGIYKGETTLKRSGAEILSHVEKGKVK